MKIMMALLSLQVEQNEVDIINGELDIVLSYHETLTNAEKNGIEPIISPYYNIVPDSQIIFVRAENTITGCFSIVEQELVTLPSPELPLIIEDIIVCDDDYDGTAIFDLTQRDEDILETKFYRLCSFLSRNFNRCRNRAKSYCQYYQLSKFI